MKVSVASLKELSPNESPGIISIISQEEISQSGARDLMEILETVPGFDFGCDVEGVVGLGVRGNWAHEGKILLLIDGQVMDEGLYNSIQLGNHYPVSGIKKIEIIRGPGSAIYGDYAEYAVINIISESGADINGIKATADYGWLKENYSRRGGSFSAGKSFNDYSFDIKASYLEGNRTDKIYTDVFGTEKDLNRLSRLDNTFINCGLNYKGFSFRGIADLYRTTSADEYQEVASEALPHLFDSYFLELAHKLKPVHQFSLSTVLSFKDQTPWKAVETGNDEHAIHNINNERTTLKVTAQYDPHDNLNIIAGSETYFDHSKDYADFSVFKYTGNSTLDYYNTAFFGQILWKTKIATVTAGARQNFNSEFESSLVPRFGLTRAFGKAHVKALYSFSYRAPGSENINMGMDLEPEITRVAEFEAGYQFHENFYMGMNLFDMETNDLILYYFDWETQSDAYINKDKSGTQGLEAEAKYRNRFVSINAGYSWYTAENKTVPEEYAVQGNKEAVLALANNKFSVSVTSNITKKIQASMQAISYGKKYYISAMENDNPVYTATDPFLKLNFSLSFQNILVKGFTASAGVYNLLDGNEIYIQPYNSLHAPLPGHGREFRLQLSYQWSKAVK